MVIKMRTKICGKCSHKKKIAEFYNSYRTKDKKDVWCKRCKNTYNDNYRKTSDKHRHYLEKRRKTSAYKEYQKRKILEIKFGLTLEKYLTMLRSQNESCKICSKTNPNGDSLAVDHCHDTGRIRGLLCNKCNVGLGCFNDKTDLLQRSINYLNEQEINNAHLNQKNTGNE